MNEFKQNLENSHNIEVTLKELITDLLKKSWIIFISILLFSSFLVGYKYISDNMLGRIIYHIKC